MKLFSLVRTTSAFVAGLILALSLQTALADDPTEQPPSGNISPSFYSNSLEQNLYIGYDDTITPFDTSYLYADATQLAVGYASPGDKSYSYLDETSGIFVQRDDVDDNHGAITGITNHANSGTGGVEGKVIDDENSSAYGYLGYLDSEGALWGLYTDNDFAFNAGKVYSDPATVNFYSADKNVEGGVHINKNDGTSYGSLYGYDGYIGSLVDRASGSAIWGWNANTGNSIKAVQGWLGSYNDVSSWGDTKGILGYRDSSGLEHGVYGYKAEAGTGESGVQGTVTTTGVAGTISTSGFLGYVDRGVSYGVYTTGTIYGGNIQATNSSGVVYTDNLTSNIGTLNVTASSGAVFNGPVTAESFGTFDYDYTYATSGGSTSVSKTCDGADEILIACSGRSTSDNFLGAYQSSSTCYATRSSTSGTLYVYAYCFDPTT